jgi:hypothetical protein
MNNHKENNIENKDSINNSLNFGKSFSIGF